MINLLDKALQRVLRKTAAQSAVVWSDRGKAGTGTVLSCCPTGLLPRGAAGPADTVVGLESGEHTTAGLMTGAADNVLNTLAKPPTAAKSFALGGELSSRCCGSTTAPGPDALPEASFTKISHLAELLADSQFNLGEVERLRTVVNNLDDAIVTVDTVLGQASANDAAA